MVLMDTLCTACMDYGAENFGHQKDFGKFCENIFLMILISITRILSHFRMKT